MKANPNVVMIFKQLEHLPTIARFALNRKVQSTRAVATSNWPRASAASSRSAFAEGPMDIQNLIAIDTHTHLEVS